MEKYKEKIIKQCEKDVYSKTYIWIYMYIYGYVYIYIWIYMDILAIKREPLRDS